MSGVLNVAMEDDRHLATGWSNSIARLHPTQCACIKKKSQFFLKRKRKTARKLFDYMTCSVHEYFVFSNRLQTDYKKCFPSDMIRTLLYVGRLVNYFSVGHYFVGLIFFVPNYVCTW